MVGGQDVIPRLGWHLPRHARDAASSELGGISARYAWAPVRGEFGFAAKRRTNGDRLRGEWMERRRFSIEGGDRRLQRLDHATLNAEQTVEGGVAFEWDQHPPQSIARFRRACSEAVDRMYRQAINPPERPRRDHTDAQTGETAGASSNRECARQAMRADEAIKQRHQPTFGLAATEVREGHHASRIVDQTGGGGAGDGFESQEHGGMFGMALGHAMSGEGLRFEV